MSKLIMCRGIPGSGKSYWANQEAESDPNVLIVTLDDIRDQYGSTQGGYSHSTEYYANAEMRSRIREGLKAGKTVISADTNLTSYHEYRMRELAKKYHAQFIIKEFDTPIETCIERDALRTNHRHVGPDKIQYYAAVLKGFKNSQGLDNENQETQW